MKADFISSDDSIENDHDNENPEEMPLLTKISCLRLHSFLMYQTILQDIVSQLSLRSKPEKESYQRSYQTENNLSKHHLGLWLTLIISLAAFAT